MSNWTYAYQTGKLDELLDKSENVFIKGIADDYLRELGYEED